jgi:hypothetical protein
MTQPGRCHGAGSNPFRPFEWNLKTLLRKDSNPEALAASHVRLGVSPIRRASRPQRRARFRVPAMHARDLCGPFRVPLRLPSESIRRRDQRNAGYCGRPAAVGLQAGRRLVARRRAVDCTLRVRQARVAGPGPPVQHHRHSHTGNQLRRPAGPASVLGNEPASETH